MPPGQIWGSHDVAACGWVCLVNTGFWWPAAAVGGSGWGVVSGWVCGIISVCLWGDHLSFSTPGLFGQFHAAETNSGGSLVVFVFFFSAGGSLWLTAHTAASGSSRWSESLDVCLSACLPAWRAGSTCPPASSGIVKETGAFPYSH